MKRNSPLLLIPLTFLLFLSCERDAAVLLKVDVTTQKEWLYALSFEANGTFGTGDSLFHLFTRADGFLRWRVNKTGETLKLYTDSFKLYSNILDSGEVAHLRRSILASRYTLKIKNGCVIFDTLAGFSLNSNNNKTEVMKQLIKLVPALPQQKVSPGFAWEMERIVPLVTSYGNVDANIYQSYTLDSIVPLKNGEKNAYLHWLFRYSVNTDKADTIVLFRELPVCGNGTGAAILDVGNKKMVHAEMSFSTEPSKVSALTVQWNENAMLQLVK